MVGLPTELINARGQRLNRLFRIIEAEPGHTEEFYRSRFLKSWPIKPRTWREYLQDVMSIYDVIEVIDEELSPINVVLYVSYQWDSARIAREQERIAKMKAYNQIKLSSFETTE